MNQLSLRHTQRLFRTLALGDVNKNTDSPSHLTILVQEWTRIAQQFEAGSILENNSDLGISNRPSRSCGHLHGQLIRRKRSAFFGYAETTGDFLFSGGFRDVRAIWQS